MSVRAFILFETPIPGTPVLAILSPVDTPEPDVIKVEPGPHLPQPTAQRSEKERIPASTSARMAQIATRPHGSEETLVAPIACITKVIGVQVHTTRSTDPARFFK